MYIYIIIEGSLEVKLPTIWTDEKQSREEAERRERLEERSRRERVRGKKMQMREKVGKSRNTVFFRRFVAPEGRKVGSLKRRVHAVVARSTFASQNAQNTAAPDHFWKLRCRKSARRCGAKHISKSNCTKHLSFGPLLEVAMWKSARRCGAKHISKSKCTKHTIVGPLLEVAMSKKGTPLWREAHFQVKMYKAPHVRATFGGSDVEKMHVVVARSTFRSQYKNTTCSHHFWRFGCWKSARRCGAKHISKSKC